MDPNNGQDRRLRCCALLWIALSSPLFCVLAFSSEVTGPVVSVLDGDTIEVLHNTHAERIRLSGIDCPEESHTLEILVSG